MASDPAIIAVVGATGMQGSAVVRRLLIDGWGVRALTRDPGSRKARRIAALGAEVARVDTADAAGLLPVLDGVHGVFCVQNHHISGYDGEVEQGRNVADAAHRVGVPHVVYSSAGTGVAGTGVGSWETKVAVEAHMRELGLPLTVLRPMAFMELMTERKFFPPASTWHVMPRLMGASRPVGWLAVGDLAIIVAKAFHDPGGFLGREVGLTSDVRSIDECRGVWAEVTGRMPRRFPMPLGIFERFVGTDETTMWRWLHDNHIDLDTTPTHALHPDAMTVEQWVHARAGRDTPAVA